MALRNASDNLIKLKTNAEPIAMCIFIVETKNINKAHYVAR